jgi:hypothetical protein
MQIDSEKKNAPTQFDIGLLVRENEDTKKKDDYDKRRNMVYVCMYACTLAIREKSG